MAKCQWVICRTSLTPRGNSNLKTFLICRPWFNVLLKSGIRIEGWRSKKCASRRARPICTHHRRLRLNRDRTFWWRNPLKLKRKILVLALIRNRTRRVKSDMLDSIVLICSLLSRRLNSTIARIETASLLKPSFKEQFWQNKYRKILRSLGNHCQINWTNKVS